MIEISALFSISNTKISTSSYNRLLNNQKLENTQQPQIKCKTPVLFYSILFLKLKSTSYFLK